MSMRNILAAAALACGLGGQPAAAQPASTLAAIQGRGTLVCGVHGALPGFSAPDAQGAMRGFDADFCRAVAAAVLGDPGKLRFVPIATPDAGFAALGDRSIDLLARNTTFTYSREAGRPVAFAGITFFDGQGLLVRRDSGIVGPRSLDGRRVCITGLAGTTGREVVESEAARLGIRVSIVEAGGGTALLQALAAGRCDAASTDASQLAVRRVTELPNPQDYVVLRDLLSREPLGLLVREDEEALRQVVFWVVQAMLEADEFGVTSANMVTLLQSNDPALRRLIGVEEGLGRGIGLDADWSQRVLAQVGSYAEVFDRHLGAGSPFGLDRGPNDNWQRGGLMFPLPLR
ncbi:transporter substrate-binding domain-containing protein [Falsiroseomonas selenitidurans]|uniref:Transporter substrate-binding domain-containing protein n=1 Tax=Falsiroseomonas selenitidurans TaxID=2716335 RepID=A0ABX1E2C0_9PROT|nr:transporter substrate-binding domain-containing protein [Falsiroseomonas selenitidurans]NKC29662.1 transporter substrate-binding domain-containing protein [Falsiroseomonas selenitidurans]